MLPLIASLLPDSYLPFIILGGAIAIILGLASVRTVIGFLGALLLFSLLSPFIDSFISGLPLWMVLGILAVIGLFVLRMVLTFLIGEHGSGTFLGHLFYDLVRLPFLIIGWVFKFIISLFSAMARSVRTRAGNDGNMQARNQQIGRRNNTWILVFILSTLLFSYGHAEAKGAGPTIGSAAAKRIAGKIRIRPGNLKPKIYYHATDKTAAQDIIKKGFNPKMMNPNARFGKGIYLSKSRKVTKLEKPRANAVVAAKESKYLHRHTLDINKIKKDKIKAISKDHDLRGNIHNGIVGPNLGRKLGKAAGKGGFALRYKSARGDGSNIYIPKKLYREHHRIVKPIGIESIP